MPTWQEHTDESLIAYAEAHRDAGFAAPAAMEMQRRAIAATQKLITATQAAGDCASSQTAEVIKLTRAIWALTGVLVFVGFVQIALMVWKG